MLLRKGFSRREFQEGGREILEGEDPRLVGRVLRGTVQGSIGAQASPTCSIVRLFRRGKHGRRVGSLPSIHVESRYSGGVGPGNPTSKVLVKDIATRSSETRA